MIDRQYLEKSINLIFDVERRNIKKNKIFHYVETFSEIDATKNDASKPIRYPANPRPLLVDMKLNPNDNYKLDWDTYTSLKKLYNTVEHLPGCREIFLSTLERKLSSLGAISVPIYIDSPAMIFTTSEFHSNASLAFYFLLKIGNSDAVIRALKTKMKENMYLDKYTDSESGEVTCYEVFDCRDDIEGLFRDILIFMHVEPVCFDEVLLSRLIAIADCNFPAPLRIKEEFEDKIIALRYNKLKSQLEASNEEINIHKEHVIEMISKYGFPPNMERFLLEIDELPDLSKWQSVNSGMIGNLRSFFEALVKNIADKISTKTGIECPKPQGNETEIGIKRKYIKEHLGLSGADTKLINSFVIILHKEGGHALTSEKKYFIMTKNIGIEIAYFLLSIYEEKFEKSLI